MKKLVLELPDEQYEAILRDAAANHQTPTEYLVSGRSEARLPGKRSLTEEERAAALAELMKYAGAVASGDPHSADNDKIDADLAREYGRGLD